MMNKKLTVCNTVLIVVCGIFALQAQDLKLPAPDTKGGKPLMQCMALRKSGRNFSSRALSPQVMADIFYAADGITRADGRKTVPTARNAQNQLIYATTADGTWLYQPKTNTLKKLSSKDIRALCGKQKFHAQAPLVLIYVAEPAKVGNTPEQQQNYAANHAGYSSQNVYLYAASEGLATVVCAMVDREALAKALNLPAGQQIMYSQPIGYPGR